MAAEVRYQMDRKEIYTFTEEKNIKALEENYDNDEPPSISLDPAGWITFYAVTGAKWDERIDRAEDHDMLNMFIDRLAKNVPKNTYNEVFAPFVQTVMEQRVQKYEPRKVVGPLAYEYGEQLFDGTLDSAQPLIDAQNKTQGNEVSYPNMFVYGNPDTLSQVPTPQHPKSNHPMIVCYSPLSSDARVTSLMEFEYDIEADKWIVTTETSGSVESTVGGVITNKRNKTIGDSKTTKENFALWRRRHPKFALQVLPLLNKQRTDVRARKEEYEKKQTEGHSKEAILQDTAREEAKNQPNLWLPYPTNYAKIDEPSHSHVAYITGENGVGYYSYLRLPETYNGPSISNGDPIAIKTVGSRFKTRISIYDEESESKLDFNQLNGDYVDHLDKRNFHIPTKIVTEALTLPIPNDPTGSVQKVVALFVEDISNEANRSIEQKIIAEYEEYQSYADKKNFLQKLEQLCRLQSHNGKIYLSREAFAQILFAIIKLQELQLNDKEWSVYTNGYTILDTLPKNGIFEINKSKNKGSTPIYVTFNNSQWHWKPPNVESNPNPSYWYPVTTVNIPWNGGGSVGTASPVAENVEVLHALAQISN